MHNQSENQSVKQLQWLVCRWMVAMKSSLSAFYASCGTGKIFKGWGGGYKGEGHRGGHLLSSCPPWVPLTFPQARLPKSVGITLPEWTFAWPILSHPPPNWECNDVDSTGLTEWLVASLCFSSRCKLLTVGRKEGQVSEVILHLPLHPSLHPFLQQHPCLFPALTIIPVIWVTQSSQPVIFRKSVCCELTWTGFLPIHGFHGAHSIYSILYIL